MKDTFLRPIADDERNVLYEIMEEDDKESGYRAKIILLKDEGYTVPEIRMATNHHMMLTLENGYNIVSTRKVLKVSYPENTCINQQSR